MVVGRVKAGEIGLDAVPNVREANDVEAQSIVSCSDGCGNPYGDGCLDGFAPKPESRFPGRGCEVCGAYGKWKHTPECPNRDVPVEGPTESAESKASVSAESSTVRDVVAAKVETPLDTAVIDLHPPARYGFLGRVLDLIEPATEVRVGISALLLLTALGNQFGHKAWTVVEAKIGEHGHKQYPTFLSATVGRSAKGRKGTAWALIQSLLNEALGPRWDSKKIMSIASGEGIIHSVRDRAVKTKEGKAGNPIVKCIDAGVSDKRKIIVVEEMAMIFNLASRGGNIILDVVRNIADGKDLQNPTKNNEEYATDPCISVITHITKDELLEKMGKSDATNGVLNRFLWGWATRSKKLPRGKKVDIGELGRELGEILSFAPGEVQLSEAAKPIWDAMYEYLNPDDPDHDTIPIIDSVLSRGDMYLCRLALIFALLDRSYFIEPRHLQAAWAIWTFSEMSARRVFGAMITDSLSNKLIAILKDGDKSSVQVRDALNRNATAHAITQAIQKLPPGVITTYDVAGKHITTMYHYDSGKMESMFPRAQDAPWLKMKFPEPDPQGGKNPWSEDVGL
jgi:uncharacterized protein DUF3987